MRFDEQTESEKKDLRDKKILEILEKDSRTSYQQIAKKLRISHDAARYRIKKLEEEGIIDQYTIDLNYEALGIQRYYLLISHNEYQEEKILELQESLKKNPSVKNIIAYTDKWDLMVRIHAKNNKEAEKIINRINSENNRIIKEEELMIETKHYPEQKTKETKIDETDLKIIQELAKNSRENSVKIAEKTGKSVDTIIYRMKKLIENNIIRNTITKNYSKLGKSFYTILIKMNKYDKEEENKIKEYFRQDKNIIEIIRTIGPWDLIIHLAVSKPKEFHETKNNLKKILGKELKDYDTLIAYKELKNETI